MRASADRSAPTWSPPPARTRFRGDPSRQPWRSSSHLLRGYTTARCAGVPEVTSGSLGKADEPLVAERSGPETDTHVRPEEAAERGVTRCRAT